MENKVKDKVDDKDKAKDKVKDKAKDKDKVEDNVQDKDEDEDKDDDKVEDEDKDEDNDADADADIFADADDDDEDYDEEDEGDCDEDDDDVEYHVDEDDVVEDGVEDVDDGVVADTEAVVGEEGLEEEKVSRSKSKRQIPTKSQQRMSTAVNLYTNGLEAPKYNKGHKAQLPVAIDASGFREALDDIEIPQGLIYLYSRCLDNPKESFFQSAVAHLKVISKCCGMTPSDVIKMRGWVFLKKKK